MNGEELGIDEKKSWATSCTTKKKIINIEKEQWKNNINYAKLNFIYWQLIQI
jgi:hypothetical protein